MGAAQNQEFGRRQRNEVDEIDKMQDEVDEGWKRADEMEQQDDMKK